MKRLLFVGLLLVLHHALVPQLARAQDYIGSTVINSPAQDVVPIFGPAELDQLLGPIALYPDPLLAELLPAATQPSQVVEADRYLQSGGDPNQVDYQPWISEVKAMAHYPEVLRWMDENVAWTTQVGQAFRNQYQDVMDSIQRLRAQAQSLGNLQSTPQETVVVDNGVIEIVPANPEVIYIPAYQPEIVFHRRALIGAGPFITFGLGFAIGSWLDRDWDWHHRQFVVWNRDHFRPRDWWYRPAPERFRPNYDYRVWHPRAPQRVWRPEERGYEGRREPAHVITPRPREVVRAEPSRRENVRVEPERREERRETVRVEPARPEVRREPERAETRPEVRRQPERVETRPEIRRVPEVQRSAPAPAARPAPTPAPAPRPNGALVGVRSAPETRAYSNRGQQSRAVQNAPARSGPAQGPNQSRRDKH
jgi:hypothetical protein